MKRTSKRYRRRKKVAEVQRLPIWTGRLLRYTAAERAAMATRRGMEVVSGERILNLLNEIGDDEKKKHGWKKRAAEEIGLSVPVAYALLRGDITHLGTRSINRIAAKIGVPYGALVDDAFEFEAPAKRRAV